MHTHARRLLTIDVCKRVHGASFLFTSYSAESLIASDQRVQLQTQM